MALTDILQDLAGWEKAFTVGGSAVAWVLAVHGLLKVMTARSKLEIVSVKALETTVRRTNKWGGPGREMYARLAMTVKNGGTSRALDVYVSPAFVRGAPLEGGSGHRIVPFAETLEPKESVTVEIEAFAPTPKKSRAKQLRLQLPFWVWAVPKRGAAAGAYLSVSFEGGKSDRVHRRQVFRTRWQTWRSRIEARRKWRRVPAEDDGLVDAIRSRNHHFQLANR